MFPYPSMCLYVCVCVFAWNYSSRSSFASVVDGTHSCSLWCLFSLAPAEVDRGKTCLFIYMLRHHNSPPNPPPPLGMIARHTRATELWTFSRTSQASATTKTYVLKKHNSVTCKHPSSCSVSGCPFYGRASSLLAPSSSLPLGGRLCSGATIAEILPNTLPLKAKPDEKSPHI